MRSIARAVDDVQAVDQLAGVAVRIVAGHVEQCLRDRQRGAQLVGGVGGESPLFADMGLEPFEHGVEGVGKLAELVAAAGQPDSVGEGSSRGHAGRVGDANQRGEHAASENPSPDQTEHQEERQRDGRSRRVGAQEERAVPRHQGPERADHPVGHVSQQEVERLLWLAGEPRRREHQEPRHHQEPGIAEGQLEANAQPGPPIHGLLPDLQRRVRCRSGSRRRPRWR